MNALLLELTTVQIELGQSWNVISSKATVAFGLANGTRSVISALVLRKVRLVLLRNARLKVKLRFARETFVEVGTVTCGRMRMLAFGASNKVFVMLLPVLVEPVKSQVPLVRIVVLVKVLFLAPDNKMLEELPVSTTLLLKVLFLSDNMPAPVRDIPSAPVPVVLMILLATKLLFEPPSKLDSKAMPLEPLPLVLIVLLDMMFELAAPLAEVLSRMP